MRTLIVDLYISSDQYLRLYQGVARTVHARSREGLRVQFPAVILQRFLTHEGIRGSFEIRFDAGNKFAGIERLS